jgi:D-alanyl-D-alanine carboxypeptidase
MTGTHFVTPDGIHDNDHYTTFGDLTIIGKLALNNPTIRQYTSTPKQTVTLHGQNLQWKNTNRLIDPASSYYCPYAIGLKTGRTNAAGTCLLSAFQMGETELLIGVFGCNVNKDGDRFDDTLDLFNRIVLN